MMTENGISLADIAAVTRNNEDAWGMNGMWNNPEFLSNWEKSFVIINCSTYLYFGKIKLKYKE